jgi:Ran GTPase-activating protein (RanGAP) involved in mRNA processing and transport
MYERLMVGSGSPEEILSALKTVKPGSIDMLDLSVLHLGALTGTTLLEIFKAIPEGVRCLNLSANELSTFRLRPHELGNRHLTPDGWIKMNAEYLARVFQSIPKTVTTIDLSDNDFGKMAIDYLIGITGSISTSVTTLNLSSNDLGKDSYERLSSLFKAMPKGLHSLNLSGNDLSRLSQKLSLALRDLPQGLTSLDLSLNHLDHLKPDDVASAFHAIHEGVNQLVLSMNFRQMRGEFFSKFPKILSSLSVGVNSLDLSSNQLSVTIHFTGERLGVALSRLAPSVVSLDLSSNHLDTCSPKVLAKILSQLSSTVMYLDLGMNLFGGMPDDALKEILTAIPPNVKVLSLRGSQLNKLSQEQLHSALAALHKELLWLDLSENELGAFHLPVFANLLAPSTHVSLAFRDNGLENAYKIRILDDTPMTVSVHDQSPIAEGGVDSIGAGSSSDSDVDNLNKPCVKPFCAEEPLSKIHEKSKKQDAHPHRGEKSVSRFRVFSEPSTQHDSSASEEVSEKKSGPTPRRKSI